MSKEAARDFVGACGTDSRIEEALRAFAQEKSDSFEAYISVAAGFGYEFTAAELEQALAEKSAATRAALEGKELSNEEIDQVSAGEQLQACSSDYDPYDWCWFDDRCKKAFIYYKVNPECSTTYGSRQENCSFDDYCSANWNTYF